MMTPSAVRSRTRNGHSIQEGTRHLAGAGAGVRS
jgi:hypothetical protein